MVDIEARQVMKLTKAEATTKKHMLVGFWEVGNNF